MVTDLTGKIAIVFGGTSGIGEGTAVQLAARGASVTITGFTESKARNVLEKMKSVSPASANAEFNYSIFDNADFAAVKHFASEFSKSHTKLHYLVMSAGGPVPSTLEPAVANGRVSRMLAVNFVSRFPLLTILSPLLESTAKSSPPGSVRVLFVANPKLAPPSLDKFRDDLGLVKIPHQSVQYWMNISIIMLYHNILAEYMAKELPNVVFIHIHPGVVSTPLVDKVHWIVQWTLGTFVRMFGVTIETCGKRMVHYLTDFDASKQNVFLIADHDEIVVPTRTGNVEEENMILVNWLKEVCA